MNILNKNNGHEDNLDNFNEDFDFEESQYPVNKRKDEDFFGRFTQDGGSDKQKKQDDFSALMEAARTSSESSIDFEDEEYISQTSKHLLRESFAQSQERLVQGCDDIKQVSIKIASPEEIKKASYGEIVNCETLNYRNLKSIPGGIFDDAIFGPSVSFQCYCGTQYPHKTKETICERCKVPIDHSAIRRERMAHLVLPIPIVNFLFANHIHLFLNISSVSLYKIINFEMYIVTYKGSSNLEYKQLLTEQDYNLYKSNPDYHDLEAETGSEAIYRLLSHINLEEMKREIEEKLKTKMIEIKRRKLINLLRYVTSFLKNKVHPKHMVFLNLPVLPAGLRPLVALDNGKFVSSDLNDKYRIVVYRKNRLQSFIKKIEFETPAEINIPSAIIIHEKKTLSQSIFLLIIGEGKDSLLSALYRKSGLLRNKMLGKRNDFTARAVITVSHKLKIDECGVPKRILKDIFRPMIYGFLKKYRIVVNLTAAKYLVDTEDTIIWEILERIIADRHIIINRAPTLYHLGIQATKIKMIDGNSLQIAPEICRAFNADFDGDQMSIHLPLFLEAQLEAREVMSTRKNILSPVSGLTIIGPTKDICLGLYYMTMEDVKEDKNPENLKFFSNYNEVEQALEGKCITIHQPIYARYEYMDIDEKMKHGMAVTTAGRMKIWERMPRHPKIKFDFINKPITKDIANKILDDIYAFSDTDTVVELASAFKELGFHYAFRSGITLSRKFIDKIDKLDELREQALDYYLKYEEQYRNHLITKEDKHEKIINSVNKIIGDCNKLISKWLQDNPFSHVSMIINSGARGSIEQLRQMIGFRGLGLDIKGEISSFVCLGNYMEGLRSQDVFESSRGAKRGGANKSIKIALSGYTQRKMADVGQNCIITEKDCGTYESISYGNVISGGQLQSSMASNIRGRVLANDVCDYETGKVIVARNTILTNEVMSILKKNNIHCVNIRSPIYCKNNPGCCALCYGIDTSTGRLVNLGKAIGIVAAQSIGEPGSQFIMRAFQSGSVAKGAIHDTIIHSSFSGYVEIDGEVLEKEDHWLCNSGYCKIYIKDKFKNEICKYFVPYGTKLLVKNGDYVDEQSLLAEIEDVYDNFFTTVHGYVKYENLIHKVNYDERHHEEVGITELVVIEPYDVKYNYVIPAIVIVDKEGNPIINSKGKVERHYLLPDMEILVHNGQEVEIGENLCRMRVETMMEEDIVEGLNKVITLLEVRHSGEIATLAPEAGTVDIEVEENNKWKVNILNKENVLVYSCIVLKQQIKRLLVRSGDKVEKGEIIISGTPSLQEVLNINGIRAVVYNFVNSMQAIYKDQGMQLSNQHLEVLLKQMLRLVEITENGDAHLIVNDYYDVSLVHKINRKLEELGGKLIKYRHTILGITQAAVRNPSFLAAASFQETQKVFTSEALKCSKDYLDCIKSRTLCSVMPNTGTGYAYDRMMSNAKAHQVKIEEAIREKEAMEN